MQGYINTSNQLDNDLDYEALGMDMPIQRTLFYFNPSKISGAFLTTDKQFIIMFLSGSEIYLEYDEKLWKDIKKVLNAVF
jgi:hypothetical protein